MIWKKDESSQIGKIPLFIVTTSEHPNIRKRAKFLADIGKNYFEVTSFEILSENKKRYFLQSLKLLFLIRQRKISNILLIEPWYPIFILLFFRSKKIKLIYFSGNINFDVLRSLKLNPLIISILKIAEILIIKRADVIFSDAESMIKFFSIYNKRKKIYYAPEYIGNVDIFPLTKNDFLLSKCEEPHRIFTIVYISTIHLINLGHRVLPRGWELVEVCQELLNSHINDIKFIVIGSGNGFVELKNMIDRKKLTQYFHLTGFVSDEIKAKLINSADIGFCEDYRSFITHRFNLSSKIQEYMRSGVPVITGNQGDKEIVICNNERPCGICIEPLNDEDPEDFKRYIIDIFNAILYLKNNQNILNKLKANCIAEYSKRFSKESIETTVRKIFNELYHEEIREKDQAQKR